MVVEVAVEGGCGEGKGLDPGYFRSGAAGSHSWISHSGPVRCLVCSQVAS